MPGKEQEREQERESDCVRLCVCWCPLWCPFFARGELRGVSTHWAFPTCTRTNSRRMRPQRWVGEGERGGGAGGGQVSSRLTTRCSHSCDTAHCACVSHSSDCVRLCVCVLVSTVVSFFARGALLGVSAHWAFPARLPTGRDSGNRLDLTQWTHHYAIRCALRVRIPSHSLSSFSTTTKLRQRKGLCQSRSLGLPCELFHHTVVLSPGHFGSEGAHTANTRLLVAGLQALRSTSCIIVHLFNPHHEDEDSHDGRSLTSHESLHGSR